MNLYVLLIIWIAGTFEEIDGLVQDCNNSIANALELLQSCTKSAKWLWHSISTLRYGTASIKLNRLDPWNKSQQKVILLPTILS